jgi:hypothetical protein
MTEHEEDRRAVAALVHRLREARSNGGTDPLGADAEPFAQEYVAALRLFGWRPVCVTPADADWRQARTRSASPGRESLAALRRGDWATARRLEGTESVVPAQRTDGSPPAEDSEGER